MAKAIITREAWRSSVWALSSVTSLLCRATHLVDPFCGDQVGFPIVVFGDRRPHILDVRTESFAVLTIARRLAHRKTAVPTSSGSPFPAAPFGCVLPWPGTTPYGGPPFSHHVVAILAHVYPTPLSLTPTPFRPESCTGPPALNKCSTTSASPLLTRDRRYVSSAGGRVCESLR